MGQGRMVRARKNELEINCHNWTRRHVAEPGHCGRNHELDEALRPEPFAEAGPSKGVHLKQCNFDAHGQTQGCPRAEQCERAYEHKVTQRYAVQEWESLLQGNARSQQWLRLNASHGTQLVNGPLSDSSSRSPTDQ